VTQFVFNILACFAIGSKLEPHQIVTQSRTEIKMMPHSSVKELDPVGSDFLPDIDPETLSESYFKTRSNPISNA
jgi:hypothetical protein